MNDELKLGEIGALQNLSRQPFRNGDIAEVMQGLADRFNPYEGRLVASYEVRDLTDGRISYINYYCIRRLSDPDAEQSTEEQKELTV